MVQIPKQKKTKKTIRIPEEPQEKFGMVGRIYPHPHAPSGWNIVKVSETLGAPVVLWIHP